MKYIAPFVPGALVSRDAWQHLLGVAAGLPAAVPTGMYFECRLAGDADGVDWIVRVDSVGREIIAGRNPKVRLPDALRTDPAWAKIGRFCAFWADDSRLRDALGSMWLEFDLDAAGQRYARGLSRPSLFVSVRGMRPGRLRGLAPTLLHALDPALPASARSGFFAALDRIPEGATIPYVGLMLARTPGMLRLYLQGVDAEGLPEAIARIGWPGDRNGLEARLRLLSDTGTGPRLSMLHLDMEREVLPRVGVEYILERRPQIRGQLAERVLLDRIVTLGLCSAAKRTALLKWPGYSVATLQHELWPSFVVRRINCIKLVIDQAQEALLKGYLLSQWLPALGGRISVARG